MNYFLCEKFQLLVIVRLLFSGIQTNPEEFREFLLAAYPKLRQGGGFELLKISGTTRSRELVLIPCPNDGYHVQYQKEPQTQDWSCNNFYPTSSEESEYGSCKFLLLFSS